MLKEMSSVNELKVKEKNKFKSFDKVKSENLETGLKSLLLPILHKSISS